MLILYPNNYRMKAILLALVIHVFIFVSCKKDRVNPAITEDPVSFF